MTVYELSGPPSDIEGENTDEYFGSLAEAKRRRRDIIQSYRTDRDAGDLHDYLCIHRLTLAKLPPRQLALRLLSRCRFWDKREEVVPAYKAF
jgi:hypothetical protein